MAFKLTEGHLDLTLRDAQFQARMARLDKRLSAINARMTTVSRTARRMLMGGAVVVGGAIKAYASFESQMANVSTMLDEAGMRLMPMYSRAVRQMSIDFGESTATLSRGLYDILSASVDTGKALKVLETSAKAARAGLTTTAIAADAITTILNSYQLSASRAGDVSDLLFAIVKRGKTTFAELAPRIGRVASIAATTGLALEEMGAALATMTRAGVQTDIAVTALRALLTSFIKPTSEARKAAKEFDLTLNSATLRAIGLTGVLRKLSDATAEQIAQIIPNIRATAGFAAALQNVEGQMSDLNLMFNRTGLSEEAFLKQTATLSFKLSQLWQRIKNLFVELGQRLRPTIVKVSDRIGQVTDRLTDWISRNQKLITTTLKWAAALGLILVVLPKIMTGMIALKSATLWFVAHPLGAFLAATAVSVGIFSKLTEDITRASLGIERMEARVISLNKALRETARFMDEILLAEERYGKAQKAVGTTMEGSLQHAEAMRDMLREQLDVHSAYAEAQKITLRNYERQIKREEELIAKTRERVGKATGGAGFGTRGERMQGAVPVTTTPHIEAMRKQVEWLKEGVRLEEEVMEVVSQELQRRQDILRQMEANAEAAKQILAIEKEVNKQLGTSADVIKKMELIRQEAAGETAAGITRIELEFEKATKAVEARAQKVAELRDRWKEANEASSQPANLRARFDAVNRAIDAEREAIAKAMEARKEQIFRTRRLEIESYLLTERERKMADVKEERDRLLRIAGFESQRVAITQRAEEKIAALKKEFEAEDLKRLRDAMEEKAKKMMKSARTGLEISFLDLESSWQRMSQSFARRKEETTEQQALALQRQLLKAEQKYGDRNERHQRDVKILLEEIRDKQVGMAR